MNFWSLGLFRAKYVMETKIDDATIMITLKIIAFLKDARNSAVSHNGTTTRLADQ
jgi:hypothetical protein